MDGDTVNDTVVSPLTTLVAGAVFNDGLRLADAKHRICELLDLDPNQQDPMGDYVRNPDERMHQHARGMAENFGEAHTRLHEQFDSDHPIDETLSPREQFSIVQNAAVQQLLAPPGTSMAYTVDQVSSSHGVPAMYATGMVANHYGMDDHHEYFFQGGYTSPARTFVVVFNDTVTDVAGESATIAANYSGATVTRTYTHALKGFAISVPGSQVNGFVRAASGNSKIRLVEGEGGIRRHAARDVTDSGLWGLDILDGTGDHLYNTTYDGTNAVAYIVDTGTLANHGEFASTNSTSRVATGVNVLNGTSTTDTTDDDGHGTHVSGIVGGNTVGVANGVTLIPVKVLDSTGAGTLSQSLAGLDWVAGDAASHPGHAVVNLSWGGGVSGALDLAVTNLISQGLPVVIAAGNSGTSACNFSPARVTGAITVGAVSFNSASQKYSRAYYSNYGSCLDVFAPGSNIKSAYSTSSTATQTLSGTSMAAPHVTGWIAQLLQIANSNTTTPDQVIRWVRAGATQNILTNVGQQSPNYFLHVSDTLPTGDGSPVVINLTAGIADLLGSARSTNGGWRAEVMALVLDSNGDPIANATVQGDFTNGGTGLSCRSNSNGTCFIASGVLSTSVASTVFTPTGVTGTGVTYDAGLNTVNSVTINRTGFWIRAGEPRRPRH